MITQSYHYIHHVGAGRAGAMQVCECIQQRVAVVASQGLLRIETERSRGRQLCGLGYGQLQLDAVDVLDEGEELLELLVGANNARSRR